MKTYIQFLALSIFFLSCSNSGKEEKKDTDSVTETTINDKNNTMTTVDEGSADFLRKVANSGMAEVEITAMAQQKAVNQPVKDLAAMLHHDHSMLNDQVKSLAAQKNIMLPDSMSSDKRDMINDLQKRSGRNFDKAFLDMMVKSHKTGIELFESTGTSVSDPDISNLAKNTLPTLRAHLDSATLLQKRY